MSRDFLKKIAVYKTEEVERAKRAVPQAELAARLREAPPVRSLADALAEPGPRGANIIAEIKRASPSKGVFRADLNAAAQAEAYAEGGARAISVLTDETFFRGTLADLIAVRSVSPIPVLRKEFILDPYQLFEARAAGADAILLIVRLLTPESLGDLLSVCRQLGMEALVEIHGEAELTVATRCGARLIGINNRDLASFATDLDIAPRLGRRLPADRIPVAASGIRDRADIVYNLDQGLFNFLVGESLVKSENPRLHLDHLLGGEGTR
ncbi:MAG: indole-3-glycerol phosphate synthase TrpC [Desulfosarcinaceae bacterium]|nr:indole-3-glycerol phosphate synthase TrpC [Desulfosarcinaceae bacterium]